MELFWVDYLILGLLGISGLLGLLRGFVREIFSLMTWVAAVWVAIHFSDAFAHQLEPWVKEATLRKVAAFCIVLFGALIVGAVLGGLIAKLLSNVGLSGTDRLVGLVFGVMRGALLAALLVAVAQRTPVPQSPWWKQSAVIPAFMPLANWIGGQLQQGGRLMNSTTQWYRRVGQGKPRAVELVHSAGDRGFVRGPSAGCCATHRAINFG